MRRRQARLVAAAAAAAAAKRNGSGGGSGEQQTVHQHEQRDEQDAAEAEGVDLPAVRVSADHEQQVLTTKGYQQLPSTSLTLNADGVIENVYLLGRRPTHTAAPHSSHQLGVLMTRWVTVAVCPLCAAVCAVQALR